MQIQQVHPKLLLRLHCNWRQQLSEIEYIIFIVVYTKVFQTAIRILVAIISDANNNCLHITTFLLAMHTKNVKESKFLRPLPGMLGLPIKYHHSSNFISREKRTSHLHPTWTFLNHFQSKRPTFTELNLYRNLNTFQRKIGLTKSYQNVLFFK